jgi:hypothetical protein
MTIADSFDGLPDDRPIDAIRVLTRDVNAVDAAAGPAVAAGTVVAVWRGRAVD